jgi:hypothetical protein
MSADLSEGIIWHHVADKLPQDSGNYLVDGSAGVEIASWTYYYEGYQGGRYLGQPEPDENAPKHWYWRDSSDNGPHGREGPKLVVVWWAEVPKGPLILRCGRERE